MRHPHPTPRLLAASLVVLALVAGLVTALVSPASAYPPACTVSGSLPALQPYTDTAGRTLTPTCWRPIDTAGNPQPGSLLYEVTFTTPYLVPNSSNVSATNPIVPTPRIRVQLPSGYFTAPAKRYPVVLLLHGANDPTYVKPSSSNTADPERGGGSYRAWTYQAVSGGDLAGDLAATTTSDKAIFVMPEGGDIGFYADWAKRSTAKPLSPSYESFHIGQLVPWVDRNLRTIGTPAGRAVVGLSMGGGGAVVYAERHPGMFTSVAAFSGALDNEDTGYGGFARATQGRLVDLQMGAGDNQGDPSNIYGPTWNGFTGQGTGAGWDAYNARKNIAKLAGTKVTIVSGAQDASKPKNTSDRCSIGNVDVGAAVLESGACVIDAQFDTDFRASGLPLSNYSFAQLNGYVHNFTAWNLFLKLWLVSGLGLGSLTPAG